MTRHVPVVSSVLSLRIQFICGLVVVVGSCSLLGYILSVLERNRSRLIAHETEISEDNDDLGIDTVLEIEHVSTDGNYFSSKNTDSCERSIEYVSTRKQHDQHRKPALSNRKLLPSQIMVIAAQVFVLSFLDYLLLVYTPGGSVWLAFLAIALVWTFTLQKVFIDEIRFHQRLDRVFVIATLFWLCASGLTLVTYSRLALQEGHIYAGPARIVAYDATFYNNTDGQTLRANVRVTWGGAWGCLDSEKFCTADVNGSLCQTQYDPKAIQAKLANNEEDYLDYEDAYDEELKLNTTNEADDDNEDENGFVSEIDYVDAESITETSDGNEEVFVVQDANGTDEVDVVYQDSKEQVQLVKEKKQNQLCNNSTGQVEGFVVNFEKDSNQTELKVDKTSLGGTNTTMSSGSSSYTHTATNTSYDFSSENNTTDINHHGDVRQRNRLTSTVDENTNSMIMQEEASSEVDEEYEAMIENKVEEEEEYYSEVTGEVWEVEEANADTVIEEDAGIDELRQKNDELVKEIDELHKENDALNENLKAELLEAEDINAEIEYIDYGDDYYNVDFWSSFDWAEIWGSYSCEDMYNYDLDSLTFDPDTPPDADVGSSTSMKNDKPWPTINVYGSCNTCDAYIMDYYSTEHFNSIVEYQHQARTYFLWSIGTTVIACFFHVQYKHKPQNEKKVDLLTINSVRKQGHCGNLYNSSIGDEGALA